MESKTCCKCFTEKPIGHFYRHKKMADGFLNKCIDCTKSDVKAYRLENLEKIRAYDRERGGFTHRKAARAEYESRSGAKEKIKSAKLAYIKRNKDKRAAHIITWNSIRDGRLIRGVCEQCGDDKTQAHHDDYSMPMKVRWLCVRCHAEHHKKEREEKRKARI